MGKPEIAIIFIKNSKGDFFVHQRLHSKKTFPNRYGIGAGGHVEEGEEIKKAAERELKEETGLSSPVRFLFTMDFDTPACNQISHLHVTESDESLRTDTTEWQWSGWMKKEEVDTLLDAGKLCDDTAAVYRKYRAEFA